MTVANFVLVVTFYVGLTSISNAFAINPNMKIESEVFGTTSDNQKVIRYTLVNSKGYSVSVMNFGATLLEVMVPDREGDVANVNLCFESFSSYESGIPISEVPSDVSVIGLEKVSFK